eukprot:1364354-Rhodomonas_salina.2
MLRSLGQELAAHHGDDRRSDEQVLCDGQHLHVDPLLRRQRGPRLAPCEAVVAHLPTAFRISGLTRDKRAVRNTERRRGTTHDTDRAAHRLLARAKNKRKEKQKTLKKKREKKGHGLRKFPRA